MSQEEYEKLFTKFYSDFFKFKSGKKSHLRCSGCDSKKRFIINDDELVYSCGPKNDPKCGKQYTIKMPKYIHYRTLREIYEKNINGSFEYLKGDIIQYDLSELSKKMDVQREFDEQRRIIKESSDNLKRLIDDYVKNNDLNQYIEDLETLSEKRYKNSIEKSKIMKSLVEDDLSEPEKVVLRRKYAQCIKENDEFIELIKILRKQENDYIMINKPETTIHKNIEKEEKPKEKPKEKTKVIKKPKKQNCSKAHPPPPCPPGKEVPEGKDCCYNEKKKKKPKKPKKDSPKPDSTSEEEEVKQEEVKQEEVKQEEVKQEEVKQDKPKKYTFDDQVRILTEYYSKVDSEKSEEDINRIVNNRRPKGKPKGTRIPTAPWLELCEKLNNKYNIHPLK